jgi:SprT-like family
MAQDPTSENQLHPSLWMPENSQERKLRPTQELNHQFQDLYDLINIELFEGNLVQCMIVFSRSQRNQYGYYRRVGWKQKDSDVTVPEICLNIENILEKEELEVIQTLVHEMVHHWQYTDPQGKPGRIGYHNQQFADQMRKVGLQASVTGKPGGKATGQSMLDYIIEGGVLDVLYKKLKTSEWSISYFNDQLFSTVQNVGVETSPQNENSPLHIKPKPINPKNKVKYSCPSCKINVWGKVGLSIGCLSCKTDLELKE